MIFFLPHDVNAAPNAVIRKVQLWLSRQRAGKARLLFVRGGSGSLSLFSSRLQMMLLFPIAPLLLLRAVRRSGEHAVHSSCLLPDVVLALATLFSKKLRATSTVHTNLALEYAANFPRWGKILARIHIASLSRLDKVICTSQYVYDSLPAGINKVVVHNAIDDRFFVSGQAFQKKELLGRYGLSSHEGKALFLVVAKLVPVKGVERAVEAFKVAAADASLIIVGSGPELDRLKELAAGARNIVFAGAIDDVLPFYDAADCLIVPSYSEGFCLVLVEGAVRGIKIVASDLPVFHELKKLLPYSSITIQDPSSSGDFVSFLRSEIAAIATATARMEPMSDRSSALASVGMPLYFSGDEMCKRYQFELSGP